VDNLRENQYTFLSHFAQFFLQSEMFQTDVEKIKTHILCSIFFLRKLCLFLDNLEKYCTAGKVTDDSKANVHCMLDT